MRLMAQDVDAGGKSRRCSKRRAGLGCSEEEKRGLRAGSGRASDLRDWVGPITGGGSRGRAAQCNVDRGRDINACVPTILAKRINRASERLAGR